MIKPHVNYFNLKVSHWEPLVDPWEFVVNVSTRTAPYELETYDSLEKPLCNRSPDLFRLVVSTSAFRQRNVSSLISRLRSSRLP